VLTKPNSNIVEVGGTDEQVDIDKEPYEILVNRKFDEVGVGTWRNGKCINKVSTFYVDSV